MGLNAVHIYSKTQDQNTANVSWKILDECLLDLGIIVKTCQPPRKSLTWETSTVWLEFTNI